MILLTVAALAFGLLALAWGVYPALMWLRARRATSHAASGDGTDERVAVIVATRDDPGFAVERVRNLLASDHAREKLRVIVAVDSMSPYPTDAYGSLLAGLAHVVVGDPPGGKAAALNAGVRAAAGTADVLVFADVGQQFNRDVIPKLVAALQDGAAGAVTGRYTHGRNDNLISAYADFEAVIRAGQAASHSVVSASGSILAMRPALWRDLPAGLICDDLFTGLSVVRQGSRVAFCPDAVAYDSRVFTREQQFTRRARTLTGLIQYVLTVPGVLLPWRNPVWAHFILHKLLRLLTPLLFVVGVTSLAAWFFVRAPWIMLLAIGVVLLVAIGLRVFVPQRFRWLLGQTAWAFRLLFVPVVAISNGLRGRWAVWTPTSQVRTDLRQTGA